MPDAGNVLLPPISESTIAPGMIECCSGCQPRFGISTPEEHRILHAIFHAENCGICEIWWTATPDWPAEGPCPRCGRDREQRIHELERLVAGERWEGAT